MVSLSGMPRHFIRDGGIIALRQLASDAATPERHAPHGAYMLAMPLALDGADYYQSQHGGESFVLREGIAAAHAFFEEPGDAVTGCRCVERRDAAAASPRFRAIFADCADMRASAGGSASLHDTLRWARSDDAIFEDSMARALPSRLADILPPPPRYRDWRRRHGNDAPLERRLRSRRSGSVSIYAMT